MATKKKKYHFACDRCELMHIEITKRKNCKFCGGSGVTREVCTCPPKIMILGAKK